MNNPTHVTLLIVIFCVSFVCLFGSMIVSGLKDMINKKSNLSNRKKNRKKKPRKIILLDKSVNITIIGKENADELIEEIKSSYEKQ